MARLTVSLYTVHVNKQEQLEWAHEHLHDDFDNVIWSDESSIQLDCDQ